MKTTANNAECMAILNKVIANAEKVLDVCNHELEVFNHPEIYGTCLCLCNSIVINKERMMVITTDETHHTTHCFTPLYPTRFSPEAAKRIVRDDIYKDIHGNRIELEIVGEKKYYELLKEYTERNLENVKSLLNK